MSDLHLGTAQFRPDETLAELEKHDGVDFILLLGDVFDSAHPKLRSEDWLVIKYLIKRAKEGVDVIVVTGNHDRTFLSYLHEFTGMPVYDEVVIATPSKKYFFVHGDEYDAMMKLPRWVDLISLLYRMLQTIDVTEQRLTRWLKRCSKTWQRVGGSVARQAARACVNRGADVAVCGHTHQYQHSGGYINIGCQTEAVGERYYLRIWPDRHEVISY